MNIGDSSHDNGAAEPRCSTRIGSNKRWRFCRYLVEDAVCHFFNPELPNVQGDYYGLKCFQYFFEKMGVLTNETFKVDPISITAVGDELVVAHTKDTMTLDDRHVETDVVVVWRMVDGLITEVWGMPSVDTKKSIEIVAIVRILRGMAEKYG